MRFTFPDQRSMRPSGRRWSPPSCASNAKPSFVPPRPDNGPRAGKTAFYASSIVLPAKTFASAIRNHWAIENQNHWVRDVTLAEDASRIRVNPGIMARLRSQALNIARANGITNIAEALWAAALDPAISLSYSGL